MARTYGQLRSGFTLAELLIVVGIIAVLAAVVLPSLARARHIARLATCKANLHNQTRAHQLYGHNNNDNKPPLCLKGRNSLRIDWVSPSVKWMRKPVGQGILVIDEYLPFESLLCPSASMFRDTGLDAAAWRDLINSGSSYAYFWRHPAGIDSISRPEQGATYERAIGNDRPALAMDINCAEGHQYTGDYEDRTWKSHPPLDEVNVAYVTGVVISQDSDDVRLEFPGGSFEELAWFDKAHKLR